MKFSNIKAKLSDGSAQFVEATCGRGDAWKSFSLLRVENETHRDYVYCNDCHAAFKVFDSSGNFFFNLL